MAGDPITIGAFLYVVPCDAAFAESPLVSELCLLSVPDEANYKVQLEYVGFTAVVLPVDASANVAADLEWVDDSDSDAVANLVAAYDFKAANNTVRVNNTIFRGVQELDPGDTLNLEFDVATPSTASDGAGIVVAGRILQKS